MMFRRILFLTPLLVLGSIAVPTMKAAPPAEAEGDREFTETVRPFLATYCTSCHSGDKAPALLDLKQYATTASVVED